MVGRDHLAAVPVAALHGDLVAQRLDQLVSGRGRKAAKLDRGPVAAQRRDAYRLLVGIDASKAVEMRQPLVVIIRVSHPLDRLTDFQPGEFEGTRAKNVLFVPPRILVEDRLLVYPAIGVGERREEGAGREFQVEHDGRRIGRLDRVDHHVMALARAQNALWRVNDLVPARRHVRGSQRRPIMEPDAVADFERVGFAAVGRLGHRRAQIADEVGRRRRVIRVDADQHAVKGCRRMHGREGTLAVGIEARWRVGRDEISQDTAVFRRFLCRRGKRRCAESGAEDRRQLP